MEESELGRLRQEQARQSLALTRERERTGYEPRGGPERLASSGPRLILLRYDKQGRVFEARDHKGNIVPIPAEYLRPQGEDRQELMRRGEAQDAEFQKLRLARRLARARARK